MPDREKNQLFIGLLLFILIVVFGLNLVDGGLTRLLLPEQAFATVSVGYSHGLYFVGPNSHFQIQSKKIGALKIEGESIQLELLFFRLQLPLFLHLGNIENLRELAGMLTN
jgi:hypothetical protein